MNTFVYIIQKKLTKSSLHYLSLFIFCFLFLKECYSQQFHPSSQISIITASPGKEIYNCFGHSAVRVNDTINQYDLVYNYGIYDFSTPNFVIKFIRGKLLYKLGLNRYNGFVAGYERQGRQVSERVLNLNEAQKTKVIAFLAENYQPENREYLYDFFYDNCASRIRDLFEENVNNTLVYDTTAVKQITFRQQLDEYLHSMPWSNFGIDLILGLPADKKADFRNQMFLPDYLEENMSKATLNGKPLLSKQIVVAPLINSFRNENQLFSPLVVISIVAILFFILTFFVSNKRLQWLLDVLLFGLLTIAGCIFLFMWLGTNHQACYQNLNMLWANPLYLFIIPYAKIRKAKLIWWSILILTIVLILSFPVFPQQYHIAFIPIFFIIVFRCIKNLRD